MKRGVLLYGFIGGILITTLKWTEYRFLVVEHSLEIYSALIAATFAILGIWLGLKLTGKQRTVVKQVLIPANLIPANLIPANLIPSNLIPSNLIPSNLVPGNDVPAYGGRGKRGPGIRAVHPEPAKARRPQHYAPRT